MPEGLLVLAGRCRALASSPQIGADAIVGNYDAVEDCSDLFLTTIRCSGSFAGRHDWTHGKAIRALLWQSYLCRGLAIHRFDPHIQVELGQPSRLAGVRGDFQRKGSAYVQISAASRKSDRVQRTR